jgi:triosephosphate isomerase|tara:strand:+ start:2553 stop:3296 length:744 start_codon:yes stop_codon:yes gene_type:complete
VIIANWKANGETKKNLLWCKKFINSIDNNALDYVGICPSHIHFNQLQTFFIETNVMIGMQDIDFEGGARTGSISAEMASTECCKFSLVGHSERRELFNEDNNLIRKKIHSLLKHNIKPILCIGESFEEYELSKTKNKLKSQIIESIAKLNTHHELIIAYEPIWAIGSGITPKPKEVNSIHEFIKDVVQSATANNILPKVLYGGSVNDNNAADFFEEENIDGALVGGASMDANVFANIVNIYKRLKRI